MSVSTQDIKAEAKAIAVDLKNFKRLQKEIDKSKDRTAEQDGKKIPQKKLTEYFNDIIRRIKKMANAKVSRQKTPGGKKGGPNSGFRTPVRMSQNLVSFFQEANLGMVNGQPLQTSLDFLKSTDEMFGLANRVVLTTLFSLYAVVNKLYLNSDYNKDAARAREPDFINRQILGADALMMKYFRTTFDQLRAESQAKLVGQVDASGRPAVDSAMRPQKPGGKRTRHYYRDVEVDAAGKKTGNRGTTHQIWLDFYHVFSPSNFTYGSFQNIISKNVESAKAEFPVGEDIAAAYQQMINDYLDAEEAPNFQSIVDRLSQSRELAPQVGQLSAALSLDQAYFLISSVLELSKPAKKAKRSR